MEAYEWPPLVSIRTGKNRQVLAFADDVILAQYKKELIRLANDLIEATECVG